MGSGPDRRRVDGHSSPPDGGRSAEVCHWRTGVLGRAGWTTLRSQQPEHHLLLSRVRTLSYGVTVAASTGAATNFFVLADSRVMLPLAPFTGHQARLPSAGLRTPLNSPPNF